MRSVQISEWIPRACAIRLGVIVKLAEREGFEPESPLPAKFRINADLVDG